MNRLSRPLETLKHRGTRLLVVLTMLVLVAAIAVPLSGCTTDSQPTTDDAEQGEAAVAEDDASADEGADDGASESGEGAEDGSDDESQETSDDSGDEGSGDEASGDEASGDLKVLPSGPVVAEGEVVELPAKPHPLIGQPAPDFTMTDVATGEEVSMSDFAGQPVLVNFWATWCPPCRLEMPWFETAYQQHKDDGFVVLAVDAGEKGIPPDLVNDTVMRFVTSSGLTFPVLLGDNAFDVQQAWSVTGLPSTFMVDRDGNVVQWHSSAYPNQATLDARLEAILGEG